jgi:hypothetical protein
MLLLLLLLLMAMVGEEDFVLFGAARALFSRWVEWEG